MIDTATREKIISNAGRISFGLMAKDTGLTRGQVAGIVWRSRHPGTWRPRKNRRRQKGEYPEQYMKYDPYSKTVRVYGP